MTGEFMEHRTDSSPARPAVFTGWSAGAARYIGRVGAMAVALGIGAAVANGTGIAAADGSATNDPGGSSGEVHSPTAKTPASESTTAGVTTAASASGGVRLGKRGSPRSTRSPRMQLNSSGGARSSSPRGGAPDGVAEDRSRNVAGAGEGE